jgi:hypothetical protein
LAKVTGSPVDRLARGVRYNVFLIYLTYMLKLNLMLSNCR